MNAQAEQLLLEKLKALPPERRAEVEAFVDFLATKARKQVAFDRLLAIAPALAAAGVAPLDAAARVGFTTPGVAGCAGGGPRCTNPAAAGRFAGS